MNQFEFTYIKEDDNISKDILSLKNLLIIRSMLMHFIVIKLIIVLVIYLMVYESNVFVIFKSPIAIFLAIFAYLVCTLIYSYGTLYGSGFLNISQNFINKIGTTINLNNEEFTIKRDKHHMFQNGKMYKLKNIKTLKLYSNCILCQMNDYLIVLLPKRLFVNFEGMVSYYNDLKNII